MDGKMTHSEAGKLGAKKALIWHEQQKNKRIEEYNKNPKLCRYCEAPLDYFKRVNDFCNHHCSAMLNNTLKVKVARGEFFKKCVCCGKIRKTAAATKYCFKCKENNKWLEIIKNIKSNTDISIIIQGYKNIRKLLFKILPYECSICGIKEWQGYNNQPEPILLITDHMDGNSDNNRLDNYRLVCSNCDATLPTYKSRNKCSGRQYRRDRYKNGQSY